MNDKPQTYPQSDLNKIIVTAAGVFGTFFFLFFVLPQIVFGVFIAGIFGLSIFVQ